MASNWAICGNCDFRHVTKPSVVWCYECDEGLCDDCKEHHSISKSSRNHETVPIDAYQNLPTEVLQVAQSCRKHNQRYQIFCKTHDCPCCKKCIIEIHNECKDFVDIDDVIKHVKSSNAFQDIELTLSNMVEYIERVKKDREDYLYSIKEQKEQIETKILMTREAYNYHLDLLQQSLTEALDLTIDKENIDIHQFLKSIEKNERDINEFQSNHFKIKQHASELQTFLTLKQMEHDIATKEEYMQSLSNSGPLSRHYFSLKIDTTLEKLASNFKTFGEVVKETKPNNISFSLQKDKQAQLIIPVPDKSIDDLKLKLAQSINTYSDNVKGCTMLSDGRMAFSSYNYPGYVTVVNQDGSKYFRIDNVFSFDVIYVSDNNIAITSGYLNSCIKLIDIELKKVTKTIRVDSRNDGIALKDNDLVHCGKDKGLKKLDLRDNSVSTIIDLRLADSSYLTTFNDSIIYTDCSTNYVTCIDLQGQVNWKLKDESILKYPLGVSVDNDGIVYVIGRDSCNVVVISPDGQRHREILSAKEGLHEPSVLHYDLVYNKLLVANSKETAFLFDVAS